MRKRSIVAPTLLTIVLAGMALASPAAAATVGYTVAGWGPHQFPAPTTPPADAPLSHPTRIQPSEHSRPIPGAHGGNFQV